MFRTIKLIKKGTPFRPFHPFDPLHRVSLSSPASHCTSCHKPIPFYLNIPLFGYLISGGKCTHCHKKIDIFYPITELACLLAALVAGWLWGASPVIIPMLLLFWALITLTIIDIRSGLLPDLLTLGILMDRAAVKSLASLCLYTASSPGSCNCLYITHRA